jgi:hypothetical protein
VQFEIQSKDVLHGDRLVATALASDLFYRVIEERHRVRITGYSLPALTRVVDFRISTRVPTLASPLLEESEMILPTSAGEVVSIDRYSGEVFKQYEIGRSVPSSALFVKHKTLYLLVGIPVVRDRSFKVSRFALLCLDLETGERKLSKVVEAQAGNLLMHDGFLYAIMGQVVCRFDSNGEVINFTKTPLRHVLPPIISNGHLTLVSPKGSIHVLDTDLNWKRVGPIATRYDAAVAVNSVIYLIGGGHFSRLDTDGYKVQKAKITSFDPSCLAEPYKTGALIGAQQGRLLFLQEDMTKNTVIDTPRIKIEAINVWGEQIILSNTSECILGRLIDE